MKTYTHIRMVQSNNIENFTETVLTVSGELQSRGFQVEHDYKPLLFKGFFRKKVLYTCMIKAYMNRYASKREVE